MADNDLDPLWQDLDWYVTYTPVHPPIPIPISISIVSGTDVQRANGQRGRRQGRHSETRPLGVLLADVATTGLSGRC